jgi:hypothetical protein
MPSKCLRRERKEGAFGKKLLLNIIIIIDLILFEPKAIWNSYYLQIRKPYYNCSRIKTSPIVAQKLYSLAANTY